MPCTQPLTNMTIANTAIDDDSQGTQAMRRFATAERARPMGRKRRALERSETIAEKNFENP